ncbi:MAG: hypothetical protein QNJ63_09790 [Calothrix sp. MO_192.B10]|nr:hypothetical protein [Calothrix sp. MO_192.B10]
MLGKIVKSVRGAVNKYQQQPRTVNAQYTPVTNTKVVGNGGGNGGGNNGGISAIAIPGDVAGLLQTYYGSMFDLSAIPNMSPDQLGELVSWLRQCEWMDEHLEVLEKHFKAYIQRQVNFNQFVARVSKDGLSGAQKIDKAGLDIYLAAKGYQVNSQKLGHKRDNEVKLLEQDFENYKLLEDYNLEASFRAMTLKLQKQKALIDAKPDQQAAQETERLAIQAEKQRVKNLLTYGTQPLFAAPTGVAPAVVGVSESSGGSNTAQSETKREPQQQNIWKGVRQFFTGR